MNRFGAVATLAATIAGSMLASSALAQQAGSAGQFPSFDTVDSNLDGSITVVEFQRTMTNVENPQQLYDQADRNGDGVVVREEWTAWRAERTGGAQAQAQPQSTAKPENPDQIEVSLTGESIDGKYITDAGLIGLDGNKIDFGAFFTDDRDVVLSSELLATSLFGRWMPPFLELELGAKAWLGFLSDPSDEVFAIAPGAVARVNLPVDLPMSVVGRIFYAPNIVTLGNADHVLEFDAYFEMGFMDNVTGFVGYRVVDFKREDEGDDKIVDGISGGIRYTF
jgi:hypothetical protein